MVASGNVVVTIVVVVVVVILRTRHPCCCCGYCCCYQFLAPLDHFKMFDDVTTTPSPHPLRCYWKHLFRIELSLHTNFHLDWTILNFFNVVIDHTSIDHFPINHTPSLSLGTFIYLIYLPKLFSVSIFSLKRTFWNFEDVADHALLDRQTDMLFDYSRHPWQKELANLGKFFFWDSGIFLVVRNLLLLSSSSSSSSSEIVILRIRHPW